MTRSRRALSKAWIGWSAASRQSAATISEVQFANRLVDGALWASAMPASASHAANAVINARPMRPLPSVTGRLAQTWTRGRPYFFRNWSSETTFGPSSPASEGGVGAGSAAVTSAAISSTVAGASNCSRNCTDGS